MIPLTQMEDKTVVAALEGITARVALLGYFDPAAMVDLHRDADGAKAILRGLARVCDELPSSQQVRWQLMPDSRRAVLRELSDRKLLGTLAEHASADRGDLLGHYLILLARGERVEVEDVAADHVGYLYTAQQFLEQLPETPLRSVELNRALALREFKASLQVVLPRQFFGREQALAQLLELNRTSSATRPLYVTGLAGVGKSALLAAAANHFMEQSIAVIWFDFDRAALAQVDPDLMTIELSRQLGQFMPSLAEPLARFREQARDVVSLYNGTQTYESKASSRSSLWSIWQQELADHLPQHAPIVLVMDTYEEVLLRGKGEHEVMCKWLVSAQQEGHLMHLQPIFSGRVLPDDVLQRPDEPYLHLPLGDLAPEAAFAMLRQLSLDAGGEPNDELYRTLITRWGSSPLFIRILARFLADEEGRRDADQLLRSEQLAGMEHCLVRAFVYQRILNRLRSDDPDLRTLAYLGLVLRRVSAPLISEVLAEPCGLGTIDAVRAEALFGTLARQVWLVEAAGSHEVIRHRRDLRQVMLGLMSHSNVAEVQGIHRKAMAYYDAAADPHLSHTEQRLEADYHRLFLDDDSLQPQSNPDLLLKSLGEELERVPVSARAWLKNQAQRRLSDDEQVSLSVDEQMAYTSKQIEQTLQSGTAVDPPTEYGRPGTNDLHTRPFSDLPSFVAANFSAAHLRSLNRVRDDVIEDFCEMVGGRRSRAYATDFCESPIWRVALAALCDASHNALFTQLRKRLDRLRSVEWQRPLRPDNSAGITLGTALAMLGGLCGFRGNGLTAYQGLQHSVRRTHGNDELKALLLYSQWGAMGTPDSPTLLATGLLCDLTPGFIKCVEGEWSAFKVNDPTLARLVDDIRGGAPSKLASFQRKASSVGYIELSQRSAEVREFITAFRPLYPELYPHIRGALRGGEAHLLTFAHHASEVPVWPVELKVKTFEKALQRDPDRWTATLIHFADRCGLLYPLLDHVAVRSFQNVAVVEARTLYECYDRAVMGKASFEANRRGEWFTLLLPGDQ